MVFKRVLLLNFVLCLLAMVVYLTPWKDIFWTEQSLTPGIEDFQRLKLFTYEPSYYAMLFVPLFFFFLIGFTFRRITMRSWQLLVMFCLPLILSFSLGVIVCILVALLIVFSVYPGRLMRRRRIVNAIFLGLTIILPLVLIWWLLFPGNTLLVRLVNVVAGYDTSAKGRTYEAFYLSGKILALKSQLWGIGLGQIKITGANVIKDYYLYTSDYNTVAIPNATAETLAVFGWTGLLARFGIEIGLFFHTKVWKNYYQLSLFVFAFIYQFTGSFITNVAEYVIWILAFTNVFRRFDVIQKESATFASGR